SWPSITSRWAAVAASPPPCCSRGVAAPGPWTWPDCSTADSGPSITARGGWPRSVSAIRRDTERCADGRKLAIPSAEVAVVEGGRGRGGDRGRLGPQDQRAEGDRLRAGRLAGGHLGRLQAAFGPDDQGERRRRLGRPGGGQRPAALLEADQPRRRRRRDLVGERGHRRDLRDLGTAALLRRGQRDRGP